MKIFIKFTIFIFVIGVMYNLNYAEEKYPSKPLTAIGLWSAGGATDLATRALSEVAQKHFGQPWINDLMPGAGGMVGMARLAKAKPDGYTVCAHVGVGQIITNFFLQKLDFKQDDFEPVIQWSSYDNVIAVRTDTNLKTMMDLIEYAKKNPGAMKYATFGKGSSPHFQMEVMAKEMGIKLTPVFYKGTTDGIPPVLDGIIPMLGGAPYETVKEHARAGKLRILMTFSPQGTEEEPEIPTYKQALGKDQRLLPAFLAVFVPKGTSEDRKKIIHNSVKKALEDPNFRKTMKTLNFPIVYNDEVALKNRILGETRIIGDLVKELGIGK
jgi:tripartite-type tricarboxylate transporter receptor subunit TctC